MGSLEALAPALDALVDDGRLVGWVAGVHDVDDAPVLASGGSRSADGPAMATDTVFAIASCTKPIAAVLALRLVELGVLELDSPIARWLPEFAAPRVLVSPDAPLTHTVPAQAPITLRHLLTMTPGFGWIAELGPLVAAMGAASLAPGPFPPPMDADEYVSRLAALPLANQPGTAARYHTSSDLLGVLLVRATGQPVADLLREHITHPLGLRDTGFVGDAARMATIHSASEAGDLTPLPLPEGMFTTAPRFESLATGLTSTVGDQLAVLASLVGVGPALLSPACVESMRSNHLSTDQRATAEDILDPGCGWGLNVEVRPSGIFGWAGGLGTIGYADPTTGRAAALATQVTVDASGTAAAFDAFWSLFE